MHWNSLHRLLLISVNITLDCCTRTNDALFYLSEECDDTKQISDCEQSDMYLTDAYVDMLYSSSCFIGTICCNMLKVLRRKSRSKKFLSFSVSDTFAIGIKCRKLLYLCLSCAVDMQIIIILLSYQFCFLEYFQQVKTQFFFHNCWKVKLMRLYFLFQQIKYIVFLHEENYFTTSRNANSI